MVGLILDFSTPAAAQPLNYADQEPTFPDLATLLHAQQNKFSQRALRDPKLKARLHLPQRIGAICSNAGKVPACGNAPTANKALSTPILKYPKPEPGTARHTRYCRRNA